MKIQRSLLLIVTVAVMTTLQGQWTRETQVPETDVPALLVSEAGISAATSSHVHRSIDGGQTFVVGGMVPGSPSFIDVLYRHNGVLFAGTGNNGVFASPDEGETWQYFSQGLTGLGSLASSAFAVFDGDLYYGTQGAGVFRRPAGTWQPFGGLGGNTSAGVHFLKVLDARLWAGAGGNGYLWRLDPGATDFTPVAVAPLQSEVFMITDLIRVGTDLLLGSTYGLYRSADDGASWTPVNSGMVSGGLMSFLQVDASIYALVNRSTSRLYRSMDAGVTWELIDHMPVTYAIAAWGSRLYAGRTDGLWYRDDLVTDGPLDRDRSMFNVYPVPANTELIVETPSDAGFSYHLIDMRGLVVLHGGAVGPRARIPLPDVAPGMYILDVAQQGERHRRSIIVE